LSVEDGFLGRKRIIYRKLEDLVCHPSC